MRKYSLTHLSDHALSINLSDAVAREHTTTAEVIAHIAEFDARKLYLPAACSSMFAYCVQELRLSEDSAYKRIQAARAARRFPAIFGALAEGRLHLTGLGLLAPHLTEENADTLLADAAHKTKSEIEQLLAVRFPRTELLPLIESTRPPRCDRELAPAQVGTVDPEPLGSPLDARGAAGLRGELAPAQVGTSAPLAKLTPLAMQRFTLQVSVGQETHDLLRQAQALLSHQIPDGDIAEVLRRALLLLVRESEKRKFAATSRPRKTGRASRHPRHVPARVKRAVWARDGGQCTYESESGRRCSSRTQLEFDHVEEVARGGKATVEGIRLRCRAHNQYGAECTFGVEFMQHKREASRRVAGNAVDASVPAAISESPARGGSVETCVPDVDADVVACLRQLGYRAGEARAAARYSAEAGDGVLEARMRRALSYFRPRGTRIPFPGDGASRDAAAHVTT